MGYAKSNKSNVGGGNDGKGGLVHNPLPKTERGWRRRANNMGVTVEECKRHPDGKPKEEKTAQAA